MPQCAFHPEVEATLRCAECDRYICPKDMVTTPVGYKCRECARPAAGQLRGASAKQYAMAALYGFGAALLGGVVLAFLPIRFFFMSLLFGAFVGEATRRGSGGHRLTSIATIAGVAALVGALVSGGGPLAWILAPIAAVATVAANGF